MLTIDIYYSLAALTAGRIAKLYSQECTFNVILLNYNYSKRFTSIGRTNRVLPYDLTECALFDMWGGLKS